MRNECTKAVLEFVGQDKNVIAVTADNGNEIYDEIKLKYPKQYIDYGIAECAMISGAAGMASVGKIPFLYAVTNFMSMRAYEFIRNMVCVRNYPVKFLGRSCGVVTGTYGMTHEGTEDLALLRTLPNLLVITPSTPCMAKSAACFAYKHNGSVYIRLEGHSEPEHYKEDFDFAFEKGKGHVWRKGSDAVIICIGSIINEAMKAAELLAEDDIDIGVIDMPMVKPIDAELIVRAANTAKVIFTLEEQTVYGGLGSAVAECLVERGVPCKLIRMGLHDYAKGCGNRDQMRKLNGLVADDIVENVQKAIGR